MQSGLVTVVVPVYNTERYIDRCVESIVNQTYKNLEIILVDDCSPDRCPQKCDEWAAKDPRVRVIHKENAGAGMARNTGIDAANGEYICFFDSDDYVAHDLIEKAYDTLRFNDAEIVVYGAIIARVEAGKFLEKVPESIKSVYVGEEVRNEFLPEFIDTDPVTGHSSNLPRAAWAAFYSMDLIHRTKWHFVSEREFLSEDIYSHLVLYGAVERVAVLKESLYYYCDNCTSFSRSFKKDRYPQIRHFYQECLRLCDEKRYPPPVARRCMEPYVGFTIGTLKQGVSFYGSLKNSKEMIKQIVNDEMLQTVLTEKKHDKVNMKKKILFWAMRNKLYSVCYLLLVARNRA